MVERQQIMDAILGLAERPEWTERNMDPERAKIDLVLLAARGDVVTVAGMARRWGMPRTSARRVMQTAAKLVPWLDSPKNDHVTDHEAANLDTIVDIDTDSPADSQNQDEAKLSVMLTDTEADMNMDSPADSPQSLKSADHEAEGLDTYLDTMAEPEPSAAIPGGAALFDDVQENESMDTIVDIDTDSQHQDAAMAPAVPVDTMADMDVDSPFYTFLDLSGPGVDEDNHAEIDQIGPALHAVAAVAPAPTLEDEASVEARAREMALEAWDGADARTFQTCDGEFEQFWTYRKRHFLELAGQERAAS
ncbi:MAG: hypothetical protein RBR49_12755 [Desulfovibrio desulfuricans]|nr:hypothetical protein [Desulfovibrio desulfuricans]